jgi:RNA polymerase sigma-70 factor (ECF subfamily)
VTIAFAIEPRPEGSAAEYFEKNYTHLVTAAFRLTGNLHDAEDLVQDIYVNASERWAAIESPRAYIATALANEQSRLGKRYSKLRGLLVRFNAAAMQPSLGADRVAEWREDAQRVQAAFRSMTGRQRLIGVLHFYLEFTPSEIAGVTGSSRQAVNTHLTRIRGRLAAVLGDIDAAAQLPKEDAA